MTDSGPFGLDGHIGEDVRTGASFDGATGYRWLYKLPNQPPAEPERLVTVDHNWRHNPGTGDFAVELRYRTTRNFGNVVQKGQSKTAGGYFKLEQPNGRMRCLLKDESGHKRAVRSPIATNDGQWHTIRCERSGNRLKLFVDGVQVRNVSHHLGKIANTKDLSIGGKKNCDQGKVTCDYFTGYIDHVRIQRAGVNADQIDFVASATQSARTKRILLELPNLESGDVMVLFATTTKVVSFRKPKKFTGWTKIGSKRDTRMKTRVWVKTAEPEDSNDEVAVRFGERAKANLTVVVYRGADNADPIVKRSSRKALGKKLKRKTPQVSVGDPSAWVISFWAHRDSKSTSLDSPVGVRQRAGDSLSGHAHPTVLAADSNGATGAGDYGRLIARADQPSRNGVTWTIILRPED